jgi:hypothetical protein
MTGRRPIGPNRYSASPSTSSPIGLSNCLTSKESWAKGSAGFSDPNSRERPRNKGESCGWASEQNSKDGMALSGRADGSKPFQRAMGLPEMDPGDSRRGSLQEESGKKHQFCTKTKLGLRWVKSRSAPRPDRLACSFPACGRCSSDASRPFAARRIGLGRFRDSLLH